LRGYSPGDFLRDCILYEDETPGITTRRRNQLALALSDRYTQTVFNRSCKGSKQAVVVICSEKTISIQAAEIIKNEMENLKRQYPFTQWNGHEDMVFENIDITGVTEEIQRICPTWFKLLDSTVMNWRSKQKSYHKRAVEPVSRLIFILTSVVMLHRAVQSANFIPVQLGLYLRANGVKDRAIDTLNRLGICPNADTLRRKERKLERRALVR
jgi:hypothetical protein